MKSKKRQCHEWVAVAACEFVKIIRHLGLKSISQAAKELDNGMDLKSGLHLMGSEDFAFYAEKVPSVMCFMGAGVPDQSKWVGQHNPKIIFNEDILENEVAIYVKMAVDFLEKNK